MQIQTNSFLLREFTAGDQSALLAYHSNPRYGVFYPGCAVSAESTGALLGLFASWAEQSPRVNYQLAIAMRAAPVVLIGSCGLRGADCEPGVAELGIELAPQYWTMSDYAIEVAAAMLQFGFQDLGLREVRGVIIDANSRVEKLVRRFGFEVLDTHCNEQWMRVREWSGTNWRLSRDAWEAVRSEGNRT